MTAAKDGSRASAVPCIGDAAVRKVFEDGEAAGTMRFLYATKPGGTVYYVFERCDDPDHPDGPAWRDGKASASQLVTGTWPAAGQ